MVTLSSIKAARSVLGNNCCYLSHKYSINFNNWFGSYTTINGCINHFISQFVDCPQYANIVILENIQILSLLLSTHSLDPCLWGEGGGVR